MSYSDLVSAPRSNSPWRASARRVFMSCATLAALPLLSASATAQALNNGGIVSGSISVAGDTDTYTFAASAGEAFQLRMADINGVTLWPEMQLFSPGGALLTTVSNADVAAINAAAATSGTYTLVVLDRFDTGTGSYEVGFALAPGANEGGALVTDTVISAAMDLGDLDSYTFDLAAGEGYHLRMADIAGVALYPEMRVYSPLGALLITTSHGDVAAINAAAATSGTYTLVVNDRFATGTGSYDLYYVRVPGANEGGTLVTDAVVSGTIDLGDLDSYTFEVNAGEGYQLRLADVAGVTLYPEMRVYSPTGALLTVTSHGDVAAINAIAATSGTYTLVINDRFATGTGDYNLYYVHVPGANEGGSLVNGGVVSGTMDLGDLDSFTFAAEAGEGFQLRVADTAGAVLYPEMRLYSPTGALLSTVSHGDVLALNTAAATSGTYTIVISDRFSVGTGDYEVNFTLRPGANQGGILLNGGVISATIELGDLDSYTFEVNAGEGYQVRMADLAGSVLYPEMRVYNPTGALLTTVSHGDVAAINAIAATSGTYTLVVSDRFATGTGNYDLYYVRMPGANEGGALLNGGVIAGTIDLGDLDSYVFTLGAGESYQLRMADPSGAVLYPEMRVYSPSGALLVTTSHGDVAAINASAATGGTYTLVVNDRFSTGTGNYDLYFTGMPGANEGGTLVNGASLAGVIDLGDLDSFTFGASAGENFVIEVTDTDVSVLWPQMRLYSPTGALLVTVSNDNVAVINAIAASAGTYTLVLGDRFNVGTGSYGLEFTRDACVSYCSSLPNASGAPALLTCSGDPSTSLVLTSTPVPNTTGQFFFGPMMLGGSSTLGDGLRCVGGATTRMLPFISSGMMMQLPNTASIALNYNAPYASGLTGTKYFQHWFRSGLSTGAGSNTSNAISVTF